MKRLAVLLLSVVALSACEQQRAPDLSETPWRAFRVDFCTEISEQEYWETRDADKLVLLQSAFYIENTQPTETIVRSRNHQIFVVIDHELGPSTWQLTLKRDQQHVAMFNTSDPTQSYQAQTDPMFYRALNTLLKSHMNESLDIFRKCSLPEA